VFLQGIGKSLMREGLSLLKTFVAKGCVLVGDPGYYERFGFRSLPDLFIDGVPPQYFLALPFEENKIHGIVVFHEGFAETANPALDRLCSAPRHALIISILKH